jgi:hypothetical protein
MKAKTPHETFADLQKKLGEVETRQKVLVVSLPNTANLFRQLTHCRTTVENSRWRSI